MKQKLTLSILLGAALALASTTQAQERKEGEKAKGRPSPEERLKQLGEALKLTDEQKAKLAPILKEEGEKLRAIFQEAQGDREAAAKKMQEARKEIAAKVKAVLTPEQAEKFEKLQAELAGKRKKQ